MTEIDQKTLNGLRASDQCLRSLLQAMGVYAEFVGFEKSLRGRVLEPILNHAKALLIAAPGWNRIRIICAERLALAGEAEIPHLHWFPADELEAKNTPMSAYNTKQGAGALRPMGRLSLFKNVYSVLGHLGQAMNKLKDTNKITGSREGVVQGKDAKILEIIIVGSLAGGTGAGTLVDMACRRRAWWR